MTKALTLEEIKKIGNIPMNFVVGMERSGTTLFQVMLNAHPGIVAPPESKFIVLLNSRYGAVKHWTDNLLLDFCNDLYKEGLFAKFWNVDKGSLLATFFAAKEIATFPLLCKLVFYHAGEGKTPEMFFDKNPVYYYALPELQKLFPEAKFIHIVRDYRAIVNSYIKVYKLKKPADIAFRWMRANMLIEEAKRNLPQNYFTLKYNTLVNDTPRIMPEVCKFLGIAFDGNMVTNHISGIYSSFHNNKKEDFKKFHKNVFRPIDTTRNEEWKVQLSAEEAAEAEAIAGEYGYKMYGFEPNSANYKVSKNSLDLMFAKLKYKIIRKMDETALFNPWLYFNMRGQIWRSF